MEETKPQEEEKKKKKWLLLLLLLLLLIFGGYFIYDRFIKKDEVPVTVIAGDFLPEGKDASKMSDKELANLAQQNVDDSQFNMMITSEATFNSDMTGNLQIKNPDSNHNPVNVVVTLDSSGDVVYSSGAIQPGEEIKQATLEKKLSAGDYPATATFNLYDPDTNKKTGEVASAVTLMVQ